MVYVCRIQIVTVLTTFAVVVCAVLTHYEGLRFFTVWISRSQVQSRPRIVLLIYGLLALHALEICFFGSAYWLLIQSGELGSIVTAGTLELADCIYFSATVYSTLGFGDLIPTGSIRLLAGIESVTGLPLITWSASFTYLEMARYWRN